MEQIESNTPKKRFIESSSFYKNNLSADPFSNMKIEDSRFLDEVPHRSSCPKCHKSRRYYCYTCYVPVQEVANKVPVVSLPVKIDIIKHPKEVDGKSTSAHAAVLAPDDVNIYTYPDIPCYENEKVLLVFPAKSAILFQDWWILHHHSECDRKQKASNHVQDENERFIDLSNCGKSLLPFSKVVFIDSTWKQSKALYSDPRIRKLPCVLLSSYKSVFWRYYRGKHETHLSTIEAIYYFLIELHGFLFPDVTYDGQYDNMLFLFKFMYFKIRTLYDPLKLKAYQDPVENISS